jgi:uncharacterized protein (DUF1330 family)
MNTFFKQTLLASAVSLVAATSVLADPVYMIAQIQIEDQEKYFNEYGKGVIPIVNSTGAKVLVATPTVNSLEGDWVGNWTVVIEFPSEEAAMSDWYNSDDYVDIRKLRMDSTSMGNLVIAPAFVPPSQ